jgi:hypothetical protein
MNLFVASMPTLRLGDNLPRSPVSASSVAVNWIGSPFAVAYDGNWDSSKTCAVRKPNRAALFVFTLLGLAALLYDHGREYCDSLFALTDEGF